MGLLRKAFLSALILLIVVNEAAAIPNESQPRDAVAPPSIRADMRRLRTGNSIKGFEDQEARTAPAALIKSAKATKKILKGTKNVLKSVVQAVGTIMLTNT
ncbi:hypothetical protein PF005_g23456 [Phytophthora fragariae]|uniref:RxLR effector protein n=1 Tax=Phytophthora fragariae TaxID=53985 RepID=A0A6A3WA17_9STRA|nr:hypothetical protein PF003_g29471 [Phytophthora fragariae]KAE8925290.1 hypothetical protein PF009_g24503 [Phytophthora fragariae]KAE8980335.1 hypothetical protein PF011_g22479 [Phytophthora fragariae]KAE9065791.1 hypothetical protein PF010_g28063 [Phytophthora fragariae]KAE9078754.1 hypothetical protein PF007_g23716 [Phytophthora fragariae]